MSTSWGSSPTFKPVNLGGFNEVWGPPAPPGPYGDPGTMGTGATLGSVFNGTIPNGTWSLYVITTASGDGTGAIAGGWCLGLAAPFQVGTHRSSVAVVCSPASVRVAQTATCQATVTGATHPQGLVGFASDSSGRFGSSTCALKLIGGNQASCLVTYTPTSANSGTHTITASYGGDTADQTSQGSTTLGVQPASSTTTVSCARSAVLVGKPSACTATVTGAAGTATPTGEVSFGRNLNGVFSATACALVAGGGSASCGVTYTPSVGGQHKLYANYGGDADHSPSHAVAEIAATAP